MRVLKEPLLHFALLGAAIFMVYAWLDKGAGDDEIVVTRGQQANLIASFESAWQRPPTTEELDELLRDHIRQEIAYREAGEMELDRDDIVIRRRLRQKLELLTEDLASLAPPTEAELDAYFGEHAEKYRLEPRYSFEQIYVSRERHEDPAADAARLLAELAAYDGELDFATRGDPISLPPRMRDAPRFEIAATFGDVFAASLAGIAVGVWSGPIESGYGLHLVKVLDSVAGRIPARAEVTRDVTNDYLNEQRTSAVDALYAKLAEAYTITVEPLDRPRTDTSE